MKKYSKYRIFLLIVRAIVLMAALASIAFIVATIQSDGVITSNLILLLVFAFIGKKPAIGSLIFKGSNNGNS